MSVFGFEDLKKLLPEDEKLLLKSALQKENHDQCERLNRLLQEAKLDDFERFSKERRAAKTALM